MKTKLTLMLSVAAIGVCAFAQTGLIKKYYVPEVQVGADSNTALYLVNPGEEATNIEIFGFSADGATVAQADSITSLGAKSRVFTSAADLWPGVTDIAWIQVGSQSEIYVVAEIWGDGTKAAYWASSGLDDNAYMPHVAKNTTTFSTTLSAINGSGVGIQTALRPRPSGSIKVVPEHASAYSQARHDVLDYWADLNPINWVFMESNSLGLSAMEYFDYIDGNLRRAALGLNTQSGTTLRFLHVATNTATFWTGMVYINVGDAAANITETYYDSTGNVLSQRDVSLDANEKVTLLFDANTMDPVPEGTAWMKAESSQELVGYELFGSTGGESGDFFTGLQGNYSSNQVLDYPHYQASENAWIGYVAVNVGDEAADITFSLMNDDGSVSTSATVSGVQPNQKVTRVGGDLFSNASGTWVRAEASASEIAGFALWGDLGTPRVNLSGVNAAARAKAGGGPGPVERTIVEEAEDNSSYANAQVLTPVGGGWNLNVIGELAQNDAGAQTNDYGNGTDDIEDVYKITLTEPTALVIATTPAVPIADIDMFVVGNERPDGNWFDADPDFDADIDYAATAGGYESVARVFQPGTYYIMVSLFEGDAVSQTDYGLLVSSFPMVLETFDSSADADNYLQFFLVGADDTDGAAAWAWTEGPVEGKHGPALSQLSAPSGSEEISWFVGPELMPPDTGTTVIDYQVAILYDGAFSEEDSHGFYLWDVLTEEQEFISGFSWNADAASTAVNFEGSNLSLLGYLRWDAAVQGDIFSISLEPGRAVQMSILATNNDGARHIFDNIRVFNIQSSPNAKRDGKAEIIVAPSASKPKLDANRNLIRRQ